MNQFVLFKLITITTLTGNIEDFVKNVECSLMSGILKETVSGVGGIPVDVLVRESHVRLLRKLQSGIRV